MIPPPAHKMPPYKIGDSKFLVGDIVMTQGFDNTASPPKQFKRYDLYEITKVYGYSSEIRSFHDAQMWTLKDVNLRHATPVEIAEWKLLRSDK